MQEFAITSQPLTSVTAVTKMSGVMDAAHFEAMEDEFNQLLESGIKGLVLDLSALESVTSAGLGAVVNLSRLLASRQGKLIIAALRPKIMGDIEMLGIENSLCIVESMDQARKQVASLQT